jgi:hypothetical protein
MTRSKVWALVLVFWACSFSLSKADTTANLINPGQWLGVDYMTNQQVGQLEGSGGGPGPAYNTNTDTIRFSWGPGVVVQTIAINQALSGTGIVVNGYNWAWTVYNDPSWPGSLSASILTKDSRGEPVHLMEQQYSGAINWQRFSGTETYASPYSLATLGSISMQFSGIDSVFWSGFYGPRVRQPSLSLNYSVDQCVVNVLSSTDCPGYQQAYLSQQCQINTLYDPACPGYQAAYLSQQCSSNALYSTQCPGYQQAYHEQQCSLNPLYATTCSGYADAYFAQQCLLDSLYDTKCPGYADAYFAQQCELDGLYNNTCPNYAEAYAKKSLLEQQDSQTQLTTSTKPDESPTVESPPLTSVTSPTSVSPAAVTSVIVPASPVISQPPSIEPAKQTSAEQEQKNQNKKTEAAVARSIPPNSTPQAARAAAAQRAQQAAEAAGRAATLEDQQATQGILLGLINFNPAFSAYQNSLVPDLNAAEMARQYSRLPVDNARALRQMNRDSDRSHSQMIDQQYRK